MSETLVPIASALPPIATSLTPGLPTAAELFDFAAGAERRCKRGSGTGSQRASGRARAGRDAPRGANERAALASPGAAQ